MNISPIQGPPHLSLSAKNRVQPRAQGLAQVPDRLEDREDRRNYTHDNPPSLFKEFFFKPIFEAIKFVLRGIFTFFDFLRESAFEEKPTIPALNREVFLNSLRSVPNQETILVQFAQVYSVDEQNQVYCAIGEAYEGKVSWKEMIWTRSQEDNIELGSHLVRQNPFLLRDYL